MNNTDVVIDLETWSLRPDAAIRSIGAVAFNIANSENHATGFYTNVADRCNGGDVDAGTAKWWDNQHENARTILLKDQKNLQPALRMLIDFVKTEALPETRVWSNGLAFDIPILRMAASRCKLDIQYPWNYRNERDTRTIYWLAEMGEFKEPPFVGDKHNALHDALHEAKRLQAAWRSLYGDDSHV